MASKEKTNQEVNGNLNGNNNEVSNEKVKSENGSNTPKSKNYRAILQYKFNEKDYF